MDMEQMLLWTVMSLLPSDGHTVVDGVAGSKGGSISTYLKNFVLFSVVAAHKK